MSVEWAIFDDAREQQAENSPRLFSTSTRAVALGNCCRSDSCVSVQTETLQRAQTINALPCDIL